MSNLTVSRTTTERGNSTLGQANAKRDKSSLSGLCKAGACVGKGLKRECSGKRVKRYGLEHLCGCSCHRQKMTKQEVADYADDILRTP